jgi:hypothetical protein
MVISLGFFADAGDLAAEDFFARLVGAIFMLQGGFEFSEGTSFFILKKIG